MDKTNSPQPEQHEKEFNFFPPEENNEPVQQAKNKASTISSILKTAKKIIYEDGLQALKINRLARECGRSKSMIYEYFGDINGLLKIVLMQNDPWIQQQKHINDVLDAHRSSSGRHLAGFLLKRHLTTSLNDPMARVISILELTEKNNKVLKSLCRSREELGDNLFEIMKPLFDKSDIDIRMICALLLGGINYMVLHKEGIGSTFFGVDINQDKESLSKTIDAVLTWSYDQAKAQIKH